MEPPPTAACVQVGGLLSWKGTVTRTTEVRPELYMASFRCKQCGERVRNVEQQFVLTYPMMCGNPGCGNKSHWTLLKEESRFVDWQRAKVQENSDEVRARLAPPDCVRATAASLSRHLRPYSCAMEEHRVSRA